MTPEHRIAPQCAGREEHSLFVSLSTVIIAHAVSANPENRPSERKRTADVRDTPDGESPIYTGVRIVAADDAKTPFKLRRFRYQFRKNGSSH
ncbi:hypothetical protein AMJ40_06250 [candidate division TA06 bacterium DG_26]|uniref:Uncharacterized protein n=1 Tax=candidate division TA06 bacterium DG_26 TaxID=1703771 RepID=A0A0S7WG41_UNCT6|nr:MAG: hypothetical protein AMJ40_06250 [candidate division TA06 bacterium DG_26]